MNVSFAGFQTTRRRGLTVAAIAFSLILLAVSTAGAAERMVLAEYFTSVF
jgi:hypothetical protein